MFQNLQNRTLNISEVLIFATKPNFESPKIKQFTKIELFDLPLE